MAKRNKEKQPREYTKRQLSSFKKQQRRHRFILFGGISVIFAVVLIIIAGWFAGEYLPYHKVIAKVYDKEITQADLIDTLEYYYSMYTAYGQNFDLETQSDYILSAMVQNELVRRGGAQLGFTVSDEEVKEYLGENAKTTSKAVKEIVRISLLTQKLKTEYFGKQVGDNGTQVLMNAMLVESEEIIPQLRERLLSGDNFTILAEEYAVNPASKDSKGVFDWHPQSILKDKVGSSIPVDWAFRDDVTAGQISDAIADNVSSKQLGYWLIRLNEKPVDADGETSANVSALLVSSMAEAERVKTLLEATDNISAIADKYSQYSPSKQGHGELGIVTVSQNISAPFNEYVFNAGTVVGEWSNPIKDTRFWTTGGAWLVQVVDKEINRPYSTVDKDELINDAYTEWSNALWTGTAADIVYEFSDVEKQWAIDKVNRRIDKIKSG